MAGAGEASGDRQGVGSMTRTAATALQCGEARASFQGLPERGDGGAVGATAGEVVAAGGEGS